MKRYWVVALALSAFTAACGANDDTAAVQTQLSALQTQVAQPTPTPTPTPAPQTATATPKPDLTQLCDAVEKYRQVRRAEVTRENEIIDSRSGIITNVTDAEKKELQVLYEKSFQVAIPLPPAGAIEDVRRVPGLVRDMKASDSRHLSALFARSFAAANAELAVIQSLQSDLISIETTVCQ